MNEKAFEEMMIENLNTLVDIAQDEDSEYYVEFDMDSCRSFEECSILTMNKGIVVNMKDGSQFQLTIVKSR